ncbi:citrate transporter [Rhodothalassium salexigens DSM 2132]|uniref:Citrate transporter n=1 Tax=Rhodothalassium salexigens DSM 2132 TaxID=1188247 RepID=A0A4R2PRV7_RHOSA|nr:SLC13 family permease [Rhodothalassium salexigens]MBB4210415.1 di/tricarboxylate transporter [Rhodothalassium salexigens DSM 2132]MBK1640062.1 hypothetical protein [Rhodothalassium salexigens DSM 2132]TCP38579.1 citrate transporter [Rhodothalassium salexigens DSM 2132]
MTAEQGLIVALLVATLAALAWGRWRTELVALSALAAALATGLVAPDDAFAGLADPAVITVVEILMLAGLLARSGLVDRLATPVLARLRTERQLVGMLCLGGAGLSMVMNNIGALAIMLPVAYAGCRRQRLAPGRVLMALSFATLLGGMCSLIGTPPNLVVSAAKQEALGAGIDFFAFAMVGGPATLAGLAWLWLGRRPTASRAAPDADADRPGADGGDAGETAWAGKVAQADDDRPLRDDAGPVLFEARVTPATGWAGQRLPRVEAEARMEIVHVVRQGLFVFQRRDTIRLEADDILVLRGPRPLFDRLAAAGAVIGGAGAGDTIVEAVVAPASLALGSPTAAVLAFEARGVRVAGLRGGHPRADARLGDVRLSVGDVAVLAGPAHRVRAAVDDAGLLALAHSGTPVAGPLDPLAAVALLVGVLLAGFQILAPELAFGAALLVAGLSGAAALPDLIRRIDWRAVLMLAALIPVAEAFEHTGAAAQLARPLLALAHAEPMLLIAGVWLISALITPFVNNVAAAAIMAPVALNAAQLGGTEPDILLLAVAAGASTDFLTPFGHHNNTIVMGAAGYRLRDFLVQGAPLTLIVGATSIAILSLAA